MMFLSSNKLADNKIKRIYYFREFPDRNSIEKMDFAHKLGWMILDKLEYTREGNSIILDCKNPVKSIDIVSFYKQMYEIGNLILYHLSFITSSLGSVITFSLSYHTLPAICFCVWLLMM